MSMIQKKRDNRRKEGKFRPERNFIKHAVEEYLANGGTITKLEPQEDFVIPLLDLSAVDEFLNS
jgi:hypothetical protein